MLIQGSLLTGTSKDSSKTILFSIPVYIETYLVECLFDLPWEWNRGGWEANQVANTCKRKTGGPGASQKKFLRATPLTFTETLS